MQHWLNFLSINTVRLVVLCHEKAWATSALRAHTTLMLYLSNRSWLGIHLDSASTFLDTKHIADGFWRRLLPNACRVAPVPNHHSWTSLDHLKFLAHRPIFLPQLIHLLMISHLIFQLSIFLFQNKQLLMKIMSASLTLQIQDVLQMLNFLLELLH